MKNNMNFPALLILSFLFSFGMLVSVQAQEVKSDKKNSKVQPELSEKNEESQTLLLEKQKEILTPVLVKLRSALADHFQDDSFTLELKSSSEGVNIVINDAEGVDITKQILEKLGVNVAEKEKKQDW